MHLLRSLLDSRARQKLHTHWICHISPTLISFFFRSASVNNNWIYVYGLVEDLVNKFKKYGFSTLLAPLCCGE